jgi:hypothetical protein
MGMMKAKQPKRLFNIVLSITMLLSACSGPAGVYIDIKQGAILSCDRKGLGEIIIDNDSSNLTLRTYMPVIYFNKKNVGLVAQTDPYNYANAVTDFDFKLKPNCKYTMEKRMGSDRGNFRILFKTDSVGRVKEASDTACN